MIQISAKRPDLVIENLPNSGFAVSSYHKVKIKECNKRDKYLDLARELKKSIEEEGDDDTNCGCFMLKNAPIATRVI